MKYWQKGSGFQFRNSDDCYGEEFAPQGAPLNLAVISVKGRYPEAGFMYNQEAHEMAYVITGSGEVINKAGERQVLHQGDVVYFSPEERIAWSGDMTLAMPCSPPFDPNKHKAEE